MTIRYLKPFLFAATLYGGEKSIHGQNAPLHQFTSTSQALVQKEDASLLNIPPPIIIRNKPSVLVWIDGEPVITVDTVLRMYRILNTPYLIIKNHNDNKYYLYGKGVWYVSDSATTGYVYRKAVPPVIRLMDSLVRKEKTLHIKSTGRPAQPPEVVITQEPAILLYTEGRPDWEEIKGTGLAYVRNTPNHIFKDTASRQAYILVSGRWYKSLQELEGPWEYLPAGQLPSDFVRIPETFSGAADILIHVKGSQAALQAIAQTAELRIRQIDRGIDSSVSVIYDGGPEFASLPGSELFVAQNSDLPVFSFRDDYYTLRDAIWYKSHQFNGPWEISTQTPPGIDQLLVNSPFYYARYVHITDTSGTQVKTGFTGGYLHTYIQDNVVVFGTGNIYDHWCRQKFLPRPLTWLQGIHYKTGKGWENQPLLSYYHFKLP